MADLNKFLRSKDRIAEILKHLTPNDVEDERTYAYISNLQKSIRIIENKMEEFERNNSFKPNANARG